MRNYGTNRLILQIRDKIDFHLGNKWVAYYLVFEYIVP